MKTATKLLSTVMLALISLTTTEVYANLETLQITDIRSTTPGTVEITVNRPQTLPSRFLEILVYRADGETTSLGDFQRIVRRVGNATYPHIFMDTAYSPEIYAQATSITIKISGLKSGAQSFYVTQMEGSAIDIKDQSDPSNVIKTTIAGNQSNDGQIVGSIQAVTGSSSVQESVVQTTLRSWPNPVTTQFRIECPILSGIIQVYVVDALGNTARIYQTTSSNGICMFDVSSLPNGSYTAVLASNHHKYFSQFTVLH